MSEANWTKHLLELRRRLIISLSAIGMIFLLLVYFANPLYHLIALPLLVKLAPHEQMIAISVTAPVLVPLKLTLFLSLLIAIPILLYQLWQFIAPGLYQHERQLIWPLLLASTLLFYLGMMFAYFIIFPMIFAFFVHATPNGVVMMTDINAYLSFVMKLLFAFGVAFEIPMLILVLLRGCILSYHQLKSARPYVIIIAFVLGMLLTPPDVISQVSLAIPMWLLYEVGLLVGRYVRPPG